MVVMKIKTSKSDTYNNGSYEDQDKQSNTCNNGSYEDQDKPV